MPPGRIIRPRPHHQILIIDDELQIRRLLRLSAWKQPDSRCTRPAPGRPVWPRPRPAHSTPSSSYWDLPDLTGVEVGRRLREWSQVPELVVTVRAAEGDTVQALDAGADDYVTKPFGTGEIIARIRADPAPDPEPENERPAKIGFGEIEVEYWPRAPLGAVAREVGQG